MRKAGLFSLSIILFTFFFYGGQEEEEEKGYTQPLQELFQTESVYPQEKGEVQLTLVLNYNKTRPDASYLFPFSLEYGITDSWQIEAEFHSMKMNSPLRFHQIEVGTKYSFMNIGSAQFHSAVGLDVGIPVGENGLDEEESELEFEPYLVLAKDFPKLGDMQLFTEIRLGVEKSFEDVEFNWNVGLFIPLPLVCLTGELNYISGEEKELYFTPGLVWDLPGTWEIGIGCPIGLNDDADDFRFIIGILFEFDT